MKIAPLLAQFFYSTKQLDIPGIGSFHLEGDPFLLDEKKPEPLQGITFHYDRTVKESPELIAYVSQHTGKIKALASADLESFWELAIQFLQIGKPFILEGIGSLSKLQSGGYSFSPGLPSLEKIDPEKQAEDKSTDETVDYKSILYIKKIGKAGWRKPVGIFLFIAGLGAAIWGGYMMSRPSIKKELVNEPIIEKTPEALVATIKDSNATTIVKDSTALFAKPPATDSFSYKFVVESAEKKRALSRFEFLRQNGIAVKMQTNDSLRFELYFLLPSLPTDTIKIRDSLARFYTPAGKKAYVKF